MKITRRRLRNLIKETLEEVENTCWDGYRPGAQTGVKTKKGKKGTRVANCEKINELEEAHHNHGGYDDSEDWYEERRLMDMDDRVRDVPQDMMDRVMNLRRGDLQDHMLDLVDAYEAKFEEQPGGIPLSMLVKNLEDAERMDESAINERRMASDVFKIVTRALNLGPKTHQQLLAHVLDAYPNTSDEEIDYEIDQLEDSGHIIFDPRMQKYR